MASKANLNTFRQAIHIGNEAAFKYVRENAESDNWYPCGLAWVTYKCRKNAAESAVLVSEGFRWDDYRKRYTLCMGKFHRTQSMNYQIAIADAFKLAAMVAGTTFEQDCWVD